MASVTLGSWSVASWICCSRVLDCSIEVAATEAKWSGHKMIWSWLSLVSVIRWVKMQERGSA
jgi:hypothetical protein